MAEIHAGPRQSTRLYDLRGLTEGEMDLLTCLLGLVRGNAKLSPAKYAARLLPKFEKATSHRARQTDAYQLYQGGYGNIEFRDYGPGRPPATIVQFYSRDDLRLPPLQTDDTVTHELNQIVEERQPRRKLARLLRKG